MVVNAQNSSSPYYISWCSWLRERERPNCWGRIDIFSLAFSLTTAWIFSSCFGLPTQSRFLSPPPLLLLRRGKLLRLLHSANNHHHQQCRLSCPKCHKLGPWSYLQVGVKRNHKVYLCNHLKDVQLYRYSCHFPSRKWYNGEDMIKACCSARPLLGLSLVCWIWHFRLK